MKFSPKLKKVADRMKDILRKEDIAASIILHEPGWGEFVNHFNPSYSCAKLDDRTGELRVKAKLQDFKGDKAAWTKKVSDTVNMLVILRDLSQRNAEGFDRMITMLKKKIEIEERPGSIHGNEDIFN